MGEGVPLHGSGRYRTTTELESDNTCTKFNDLMTLKIRVSQFKFVQDQYNESFIYTFISTSAAATIYTSIDTGKSSPYSVCVIS